MRQPFDIRGFLLRTTLLVLVSVLLMAPAVSSRAESPDSQLFIEGFNAYQKSEYSAAVDRMNQVLSRYPDTPLRDMALFWISRAHYHQGNNREAARYFSQFMKEYPDSPLMGTVEEELPILAQKFSRGEKIENAPKTVRVQGQKTEPPAASPQPAPPLPTQPPPAAPPVSTASAPPDDRAARLEAEARRLAEEKQKLERVAAEKSRAEQEAIGKLAAAQAVEASLTARLEQEKAERERLLAEKTALEQSITARIAEARAEAERLARISSSEQDRAREELSTRIRLLESTLSAEKGAREALEEQKRQLENDAATKLAAAQRELEAARQEAQKAQAAAEEARRIAQADTAARTSLAAVETELNRLREQLESERREKESLAARLKRENEERTRLETEKKALEQMAAASRSLEPAPAAKPDPRTGKRRQKPRRPESDSLREKAITEYKRIIDSYPGTAAATSASLKLRELGITYGGTPAQPDPSPAMTTTARVLAFEVGQYAGVEITGIDTPVTALVNTPVTLPFELVNTGNGPDTFDLSAEARKDISVSFLADTASREPITATPPLAPGERFRGLITLTLPSRGIDGERFTLPVRASSRFTSDVSRTRELRLTASAPLLRSVIKPDRNSLPPGQTVSYSVSLLNVGSAAASDIRFTLVHPPQLTPSQTTGFTRGEGNTLVMDDLSLKSGENREMKISFTLAPNALAGQELFLQGLFTDTRLDRRESFMASAVLVETVRGIRVTPRATAVTALPGQSVVIPVTVANEGNSREDFSIATMIPAATYTLYLDQNRDGLRQSGEPVINHVGPLAPFETADILLEVQTPKASADNSTIPLSLRFASDADPRIAHSADIRLTMVRPVVDLSVNGKEGKLRPGEVATLELTARNSGSGIARTVEIESIIPPQLELVASDPPAVPAEEGRYRWSYPELGSGEKRAISVTYRIRTGTALGTSIQLQNRLSYQDSVGNRY